MYVLAPYAIDPATDVLSNSIESIPIDPWSSTTNYSQGWWVTTGAEPNIKTWRARYNSVAPSKAGAGLPNLSIVGMDPTQTNKIGYDNTGSLIVDPRDYPNVGELWWEDVSGSLYNDNANRMFDPDPSAASVAQYGIDFEIRPSEPWNAVVFLGLACQTIYLTLHNGPPGTGWEYPGKVLNLAHAEPLSPEYPNEPNVACLLDDGLVVDPAQYPNAYLIVQLRNTFTTDCVVGSFITGRAIQVGRAIYGLQAELMDFSRYERDTFGGVTVIRRGYSDRITFPHVIEPDELTQARTIFTARRALPTVFIGSFEVPATIIYGYFQDLEQTYDNWGKVSGSVVVESILLDAPKSEATADGVMFFDQDGATCVEELTGFTKTLCLTAGRVTERATATFLTPVLETGDTVEWELEWIEGTSTTAHEVVTLETDCEQSLSVLRWPPEATALPLTHAAATAKITATVTTEDGPQTLSPGYLYIRDCTATEIEFFDPAETECVDTLLGKSKVLCREEGKVTEQVAATFLAPALTEADSVAWTVTWTDAEGDPLPPEDIVSPEIAILETTCGQRLSVMCWPPAAELPLTYDEAHAEITAIVTFADSTTVELPPAYLHVACGTGGCTPAPTNPTWSTGLTVETGYVENV